MLAPSHVCLSSPNDSLSFQLDDHTDTINSIDVTENGKYLVTSARDHTVKIWDLEKRRLDRSLEVGEVEKVQFCCNDSMILATHARKSDKKDLLCIEVDTGVKKDTPKLFLHADFNVFGDGKSQLVYVTQRYAIHVVDLKSWDEVLGPEFEPEKSKLNLESIEEMGVYGESGCVIA